MGEQKTKAFDALDHVLKSVLGTDYAEYDAEIVIAELRELGFDIVEVEG